MRYTRTHEWVEQEDDTTVTVGISDRAQRLLGTAVFVELPKEGTEFEQEDPLGTIDSLDGEVINVYAPVTGEVIEVNTALEASPNLINRSPEGDGWLVKMRMDAPSELNSLMTPEEYEEYEEETVDEDLIPDDEDEDF